MKDKRIRRAMALLLCFCMTAAMFLASCGSKEEEENVPPHNSLTGATEADGYDTAADKQRVVAFVVENAPDARPQWGMDDENYPPDIVLEGEVEGGITRMLWMYADYNKLPEQIGPTRSARPPYIKFSELFDSIFIHWGQSHSKGDYVGAKTVFKNDDVDHIDQMSYSGDVELYGRDSSRGVSSEHTGVIYGDKVADAIKGEGFRTEPVEYTKLRFNQTEVPAGETPAANVGVTYSDRSFEDSHWVYNEEDGLYHTSDFENDFTRENLLILSDETEYITKDNYAGPGSTGSVTYCDYKLGGGLGKYFSKGTVKDIAWVVLDDKLILIDPDKTVSTQDDIDAIKEANKAALEEDENANQVFVETPEKQEDESDDDVAAKSLVSQNLNKGRTWIGWISSNNGGNVSVS